MTDVKTDLILAQKKDAEEARLTSAFTNAAIGASRIFALSLNDIQGAYENKKQSLTTIYNEASEAKSARGSWIGWSVFWGIVFWPVAVYTGYKAYESHTDFSNIKGEVSREVEAYRAKTAQTFDAPQPQAKPSPFGTRIKA